MAWQRPEGEYPRVWVRENGFVIRDVTPDIAPFFVQHMITHFGRDEPLNHASGFEHDPVALNDIKVLWERECLPQKVSIVALAEGEPGADLAPVSEANPPRILGGNMLCVCHKDDPPEPSLEEIYHSPNARKVISTIMNAGKLVNVFERYGVDHFMDALGLSVCPSMRGKGLGLMILRARLEVCKGLGIPVTKTVFTAIASQKIAEKAGFELLAEKDYDTILDKDGKQLWPNMHPTKSIKLMAVRV